MKAIRVSRTGGPEVMEVVDLPTPRPGTREALVRVEAAGVNFIDTYQRSGAYARELPFLLGEEGAGVVEAVGDDGEGATPDTPDGPTEPSAKRPAAPEPLRVGDRVAWARASGSYATHVVVGKEHLVRVPDAVEPVMAAAAMLQGMTAHYLTHATFPLRTGTTCLVHAAAGGVGRLLAQMAKQLGARVLATTSTESKAKLARASGADEVLLYASGATFDREVRAMTDGRGVDVVFDSVGASTFEGSLLSLRPRGMLVLFGQSSGPVPPFDLQLLNARGSLFVTRPTLRDYVATRREFLERAHAVLGAVAQGTLRLHIHAAFPLEQAAAAHRALESRATSGKLVLLPGA
jgi:NADPH:quinone reductase